ncbi:keratin, type I cytoskeletal 10 [Drosophila eugracilis]|uniref:keratin, type I cytoskeletal 10 n=1 Tax=Drosophila eugracilis TaxID=29029 RepID=UPI0007E754A2|nr:keratin, type I cytoskeletal 10 [Drosophila eugracilis]
MRSFSLVMLLVLETSLAQLVWRDYGYRVVFGPHGEIGLLKNYGTNNYHQGGAPFGYRESGLISGTMNGGPFENSNIQGGLISGGKSGGPFGISHGLGGLISGSNTGGPFASSHHEGGLISGGGGPFGSSLVSGGLISGNKNGGPFPSDHYQEGLATGGSSGPFGSSQGSGGQVSGSKNEGSFASDQAATGGSSGGPFGKTPGEGILHQEGIISEESSEGPIGISPTTPAESDLISESKSERPLKTNVQESEEEEGPLENAN